MFLTGVVERLQKAGADAVVRVHKGIVTTLRGVDAGVAGSRQTGVFLMNDLDAGILGGKGIADLGAAVGGAVVHQKNLKGYVDLLLQNGVDALGQPGLYIINGHDHADLKTIHGSFPSLKQSYYQQYTRNRRKRVEIL